MIARLRRWIRSRVSEPKYDKTKDPIVRELNTIRRESLTAARQSHSALRRAQRDSRDFADVMAAPPPWRHEGGGQ